MECEYGREKSVKGTKARGLRSREESRVSSLGGGLGLTLTLALTLTLTQNMLLCGRVTVLLV